MDYSVLCDESNGKKESLCSNTVITPRLMYDISPNSQFNIVYELGDFWTENDELAMMCGQSLNLSWWRLPAVDGVEEFVSNHGEHSDSAKWFNSEMSLSAMILVVIALLKKCSSKGKSVDKLKVTPLTALSGDCSY